VFKNIFVLVAIVASRTVEKQSIQHFSDPTMQLLWIGALKAVGLAALPLLECVYAPLTIEMVAV